MSRYSRYFLQHILWLDDGLCRYYVQDPHWCHDEILDVHVIVYDQERDAEQMLWACMEHNAFFVADQLRSFLADDCYGYHFVHKMSDQEVVRAVADELTQHIYRVVIEPGAGWAVQIDEISNQAVVPVSVEPEPELATIFEELKEQLDGLVAEQQKKYDQYEAKLAQMSEAEKAALYGKKAGTGMFSFVGDIVNMVKAFPGFYIGYLKTVGKIALYPSQLSAVMAESMATGSLGPLEAEIDKFVKPVAKTHEEVKRYKGMLQVLLTDKETLELLHDFAERYYDATHPLELTEMGASAATDIVVTVLLAIFTAGVGAAANVAVKSAKLSKVAKLLEQLAQVLKRVGYKHKLPKKKGGGALDADGKKMSVKDGKRALQDIEKRTSKANNDGVVKKKPDSLLLSQVEFKNPKEAYDHINSLNDDVSIIAKNKPKGITKNEATDLKESVRGWLPKDDYPKIDYDNVDTAIDGVVSSTMSEKDLGKIKDYVFNNKEFAPPRFKDDFYSGNDYNVDKWGELIDGKTTTETEVFLKHELAELKIKEAVNYSDFRGVKKSILHNDVHGAVGETFDTEGAVSKINESIF